MKRVLYILYYSRYIIISLLCCCVFIIPLDIIIWWRSPNLRSFLHPFHSNLSIWIWKEIISFAVICFFPIVAEYLKFSKKSMQYYIFYPSMYYTELNVQIIILCYNGCYIFIPCVVSNISDYIWKIPSVKIFLALHSWDVLADTTETRFSRRPIRVFYYSFFNPIQLLTPKHPNCHQYSTAQFAIYLCEFILFLRFLSWWIIPTSHLKLNSILDFLKRKFR